MNDGAKGITAKGFPAVGGMASRARARRRHYGRAAGGG